MKPYLIPLDDNIKTPFDNERWYKIYHDGGHHVATLMVRSKAKRRIVRTPQGAFDIAFDSLYIQALKRGLKDDAMADYIQAGLELLYPASSALRRYVLEKMEKKQRSLWARIKRFRRKANLNKWTHFVTFTYDPKKHTAESFRKKLRRCLSNLHTRKGWKYMGVFEEGGEKGTVHFHAIVYIPKGQMIGRVVEYNEYSLKRKKRYTRYGNTFFDDAFGMSDFQELNPVLLKRGGTMNYLIKYMAKSGERFVYSRGIPSEICKELTDWDIAGAFLDYVEKYALYDDVIDWERDVVYYARKKKEIMWRYTEQLRI